MFNFFKKKEEVPENIDEVLNRFRELNDNFNKVSDELANLRKEYQLSLQKVGIIRFNPFSGVGSDQSFSIALLDATNSGVVITSLYTREESRVYGKPIQNGQSKYSLSEEEKEAVEQAINYKNGEQTIEKIKSKSRKRGGKAASGSGFGPY